MSTHEKLLEKFDEYHAFAYAEILIRYCKEFFIEEAVKAIENIDRHYPAGEVFREKAISVVNEL